MQVVSLAVVMTRTKTLERCLTLRESRWWSSFQEISVMSYKMSYYKIFMYLLLNRINVDCYARGLDYVAVRILFILELSLVSWVLIFDVTGKNVCFFMDWFCPCTYRSKYHRFVCCCYLLLLLFNYVRLCCFVCVVPFCVCVCFSSGMLCFIQVHPLLLCPVLSPTL